MGIIRNALIGGSAVLAFCVHAGENLVPDGTFTDVDEKTIGRVCRGEDGPAKLFTEDATWNRCCKAEVGPVRPGAKHATRIASVSFGKVGDVWGFPVKPDTTYEFSVDVRRGAGIGSASVRAIGLNAGEFWKGREKLKTTGGKAVLQDVWSGVRGTFKTGPATKRAILNVSAWSSTELASGTFADGAHFLVDNVKVEESTKNLGAAPAATSVPLRKAVATGDAADDFVLLKTAAPAPAETRTAVTATAGETAFEVMVECREPGRTVSGDAASPWNGDHVEIWFGATTPGRVFTQVALGLGGGLHVAKDGAACADHGVTAKVEPVAGGYRAKATVPYQLLSLKGRPADGATLPFNVGRYRCGARQYLTWNALKTGFNDVANFGTLVVGDYSAALEAKYGKGRSAAGRADYEAKVAAEETALLQAKFARFAKRKVSVAPVSPIGDFSIPYLPDEIFDPPDEIRLTAAVNEKKALPVAVANLSARVEDYLVLLETGEKADGSSTAWKWRSPRGLAGFPEGQVTFRKALRMKDSSTADPTLRFDPLPETDGCCSLTVAPKEAGLAWFDFDTTGVKPGRYTGRLRVIPTCEAGSFASAGKGYDNVAYTGEMQVIPVTLEVVDVVLPVRPRRPSGFYQAMHNESCYALAKDLGAEYFLVSPWSFAFPKKADGSLDLDDPAVNAKATKEITRQLEIARRHGRQIKLLVCYSAVHVFHQVIGSKFPDRETEGRLFSQWMKGIARVFEKCGLGTGDYSVETYDEPPADRPDEIEWYHRLAKEAVPGIALEITLGHRMMKVEELERLGAVTDEWIVWDSYFTTPGYADLFARLRSRGAKVLHYQCDTSPRVPLHDYYRKKTWFGEYWKLDGDCMYQLYDRRGGVGGPDFKACTTGGFVYFLYDRAVPSIRSMAFREGTTDMLYLSALEVAAGDSAETRAFVTEAAKRVMETKKFDPAEPDRIRAEVVERILRRK